MTRIIDDKYVNSTRFMYLGSRYVQCKIIPGKYQVHAYNYIWCTCTGKKISWKQLQDVFLHFFNFTFMFDLWFHLSSSYFTKDISFIYKWTSCSLLPWSCVSSGLIKTKVSWVFFPSKFLFAVSRCAGFSGLSVCGVIL